MYKKPSYETIIDQYRQGNGKDFAFKVKQFGLAKFIIKAANPTTRIKAKMSEQYVLNMIIVAVRLGGYE